MKTIDLAMKYDDTGPLVSLKREVHYPTFRFETSEDHEIPKSGEMTIVFKKVEFSSREVDGKTKYECVVEVREITDMSKRDDEEKKPAYRETASALRKIRAEKMKSKSEDDDDDDEY